MGGRGEIKWGTQLNHFIYRIGLSFYLLKSFYLQKIPGGTTAVVALFIGKKGFIANVGDTRAVLCRDGVPVRFIFFYLKIFRYYFNLSFSYL
jgi:hypothetical protein